MKLDDIKIRKDSIIKIINSLEEQKLIEKLLIEEEYKSIELLSSGEEINKICTNINKEFIKNKIPTDFKSRASIVDKPKINNNNPQGMTDSEKAEYLNYRKKVSDEKYFDKIKSMLDEIPESNGCKYYDKIKVNIGIIADEFLMNSYEGVANFIYITPDNYKDYIGKLDLFLVVTTWKGLNGEWKGLGNPNIRKLRNQLFNIIKEYKNSGTITAFYSKEDPVNYDIFKELATKCEYIFTTCEEIIDEYKTYCKNSNVDVLKFGVNPVYHNPIGFKKFNRKNKIIFSGSWYEKYAHRIVDMKMLFDGVLDSKLDLKIVDRNYALNLPAYFFPKKYLSNTVPAISHEYLQKTHKLFDWAINFNSVKDSNTMFANRIYELQALGNILISNYSVGVNNLFPNVFLINEKDEVSHIVNGFNEEDVYAHQVKGIRTVMSNETAFTRIDDLLNKVNIKSEISKRKVLVLANEINDHLIQMFDKQSYEDKTLILESDFNNTLKKQYDIIAFFNSKKEYGRYYLEDMINGFKYTSSKYITKDAFYKGKTLCNGIEHDYVSIVKDKYRTVFWSSDFSYKELLNLNNNKKIDGGYSIDHFEFNDYINIKTIENSVEYKISVIIPSYNNGKHLISKCFNSLRRSTMFDEMEIIIVDDGSTDNTTVEDIKYLQENYKNVKTYFFNDGGSGSASRPRNKGIEIATTKYITYLDPDNEAINDGYKKLYDEIINSDLDMVVGNMIKLDTKESLFNYYATAIQYNGSEIIEGDKKDYLVNTNFKGMSIQALLVKKDIIKENQLKQIEGAIGEDTLFFYELLVNSNKIKVINLPIHIYYAAVSGSTVNSISKKFYERSLKIEREKYKFYMKYNVINEYLERRFEYYFVNWYMQKLTKVNDKDRNDCSKIIKEIFDLYSQYYKGNDEVIQKFIQNYK